MIKEVREIVWHTTPKELRELADRLEAAWKKVNLGQDVPSEIQYGSDGVNIRVRIDQQSMSNDDWRYQTLKHLRVKKFVNFNGKEVLTEGHIERELKETELAAINETEPCWMVSFSYCGINFYGAWRKSECKACSV